MMIDLKQRMKDFYLPEGAGEVEFESLGTHGPAQEPFEINDLWQIAQVVLFW